MKKKSTLHKRLKWFYRRHGIQIVLLCLLAALCVAGAVWTSRFIEHRKTQTDEKSAEETTQTAGDTKTAQVEDTPNPMQSAAEESTEQPEAPEEPPEIRNTLDEAALLAAGYDYSGAIALLETLETSSPAVAEAIASWQELDAQLVTWPSDQAVPHVFFHSLIVDPSRAFDGDYKETGYNQYMTTVDEFVKILDNLYERGYVLVSPYDVAYEVTDDTGTHFVAGEIRLPEGKKPLLMSQDDVNYYGYMIGGKSGVNETPVFTTAENDGFASRIVIGEDGYPTCLYMDAEGNELVGSYDLVPLLEDFIQEHPDFSYHGARAMLAVTGYEGVFGYRTKPAYREALGDVAYAQEVADAKAVAECLKEHGWLVVSHSYGHPAYGNIAAEKVDTDSQKWEDTVQPIVGETDILIYPHGSDIAGVEPYSTENTKFRTLYEDGYRYFFSVDGLHDWFQLGNTYYRGSRRNLDGYRMYYNPGALDAFFDVSKVFDQARTTPVPPI